MADDRVQEIRRGYAEDDYLADEPPDLGPLRAVAEGAELAEAASRLADAYGRPVPPSDPLAPLARDIARALTEAGEGKPLSERKLAAMFGKTSRRWARNRMGEAMAQVAG